VPVKPAKAREPERRINVITTAIPVPKIKNRKIQKKSQKKLDEQGGPRKRRADLRLRQGTESRCPVPFRQHFEVQKYLYKGCFDRVIISGAKAPALDFQPVCEVDHLAGQPFRATSN
jgi:hypothetical protein